MGERGRGRGRGKRNVAGWSLNERAYRLWLYLLCMGTLCRGMPHARYVRICTWCMFADIRLLTLDEFLGNVMAISTVSTGTVVPLERMSGGRTSG